MKAVVFQGPENLHLIEKEEPALQPDEVLLKINLVGLCGTDLNIYRGKMPLVTYPRIPGHEIGAVIAEKGGAVPEYIKVGDRVTVNPYTSCGKCSACRAGRVNTCKYNQTLGVQRDGAMRQYLAVPYPKILGSDKLSSRELALVEPLSVGNHAVNRGRARVGENVMVIGCGMIGIGVVMACLRVKANVIAVDKDDRKLELLKSWGVRHTINSMNTDPVKVVEEITNGEGVNLSIEAVGSAPTYQLALETAGYAGRVVYIGYAKEKVSLNTSLIVKKELDIMGSRNVNTEFEEVMKMLEEKTFNTDLLISAIYPMSEVKQAFQFWDHHPDQVIKILAEIE